MPKIVVREKASVIAEYNFDKKPNITIGNAKGNDIILKDKSVSEQHCIITYNEGKYEIKDNNTLSGTKVNDRPVTVRELEIGNVIGIGKYNLVFRSDSKQRSKALRDGTKEDEIQLFGEKPRFLIGVFGKFYGKRFEIKKKAKPI